MVKRKKFLLSALILLVGLGITQWLGVGERYWAIAGLAFVSIVFSYWALWDDLKGVEHVTVMILPILYPLAVALFYFLLPEKWLSRVLIYGLFSLGMYALFLTENIFSVATIRTIQLLRAAHAVGFLLTLVTGFMLYDTIWSFRFPFWLNLLLVAGVSWLLLLQGLWAAAPDEKQISRSVLLHTSFLSLGLGELGMILSFWPVSVAVGSLFLVSMLYVALGVSQQMLMGKLFQQTLAEYIRVGLIVMVTIVFLTSWSG